jgi:hypothetical protein
MRPLGQRTLRLSNGMLFALSLALSSPAFGQTLVHLRASCGSLSPCVTSSTALQTWLDANPPGAANPTTVDVGPGEFGPFVCSNDDYLTLRGSGRDRTSFRRAAPSGNSALSVSGCDEFAVQDLSVVGHAIGVTKSGSGDMTLTDVDIEVGGSGLTTYAWWDGSVSCPEVRPKVWWFGSRIIVEATAGAANFGLYAQCAEHWVYGSDFEVHGSANTPGNAFLNTLYLIDGGDARIFGGSVRALVGGAVDTDFNDFPGPDFTIPGFAAAFAARGGHLHAHGALFVADAKASNLAQHAVGIKLENALHAHTPDAAFRVEADGGGIARRLVVIDSPVESPFLWPPSADPPAIESVNGSDVFVETDCDSSGDCGGPGTRTEAHFMVYNPAHCGTTDPWFDVVTGACRHE